MKYGIKYVDGDGRRTSVILSTDLDGAGIIQTAHYRWFPDHPTRKIQNLEHDIEHLSAEQVAYLVRENILPSITTWVEVTDNGAEVHQRLQDAIQGFEMGSGK